MTVSGNPPYAWTYGTNLQKDFFWSRVFCEAMQALANRANTVSVAISDWNAYMDDGTVKQSLGSSPLDAGLLNAKAFRHVNTLLQLRTALETVCVNYFRNPVALELYSIDTLLTDAVSRDSYNRTQSALQELGYFDGEDVEEILKSIDLLTNAAADFIGVKIYDTITGAILKDDGVAATPGAILLEQTPTTFVTIGALGPPGRTGYVTNLTLTEGSPLFVSTGTNSTALDSVNWFDVLTAASDRSCPSPPPLRQIDWTMGMAGSPPDIEVDIKSIDGPGALYKIHTVLQPFGTIYKATVVIYFGAATIRTVVAEVPQSEVRIKIIIA